MLAFSMVLESYIKQYCFCRNICGQYKDSKVKKGNYVSFRASGKLWLGGGGSILRPSAGRSFSLIKDKCQRLAQSTKMLCFKSVSTMQPFDYKLTSHVLSHRAENITHHEHLRKCNCFICNAPMFEVSFFPFFIFRQALLRHNSHTR